MRQVIQKGCMFLSLEDHFTAQDTFIYECLTYKVDTVRQRSGSQWSRVLVQALIEEEDYGAVTASLKAENKYDCGFYCVACVSKLEKGSFTGKNKTKKSRLLSHTFRNDEKKQKTATTITITKNLKTKTKFFSYGDKKNKTSYAAYVHLAGPV